MKAKAKKLPLLPLLALAVLFTTMLSSTTLAKYSSTSHATGLVKVARFAGGGTVDFKVELEGMMPGDSKNVPFSVTNFEGNGVCQVMLDYEIQVTSLGNLPLTFSLRQVNNGQGSRLVSPLDTDLKTTDGKAVGGNMPVQQENGEAVKQTHSYELTVAWPADQADDDYSNEIDMVTVTITATQANPNAGT